MERLIILGSAAVVPDEEHDNSHVAVAGEAGFILIDCASSPLSRLKRAGLDFHRLTDLVLTHFHPDHMYGAPLLLLNMWLLGRRAPLRIAGLGHCLERFEALMEAFAWRDWPNFYPTTFHPVAEAEGVTLVDNAEFRLLGSPVKHLVPTLGLRLEAKRTGRVLAYSADTEPCPQFVRLAKDADLLLHEATGESPGHSAARQAGRVAREAGAGKLLLIHYSVAGGAPEALVQQAREEFGGPVGLAKDFDVHEL